MLSGTLNPATSSPSFEGGVHPAATPHPSSMLGNPYGGNPWDTGGLGDWEKQTHSPGGNRPSVLDLRQAGSYLSPLLGQQLQYEGQLEGSREGDINNLLQELSPSGIQSNINQFSQGAQEQAANAARTNTLLGAEQGYGSGVTAGQNAQFQNNAAMQTNNYANQMNNPQARAQFLSQALAVIMNAQNPGALGQQLSLAGEQTGANSAQAGIDNSKNSTLNALLGGVGGGVGTLIGKL